MIAALRRWWTWLTAEALPPTTGRTVNYTSSRWGHKIHRWDTWNSSTRTLHPSRVTSLPGRWYIMGHGPLIGGRLWTGDVITSRMESGRVGRFLVLEARYLPDPPDMFRAVVTWLGYEETT